MRVMPLNFFIQSLGLFQEGLPSVSSGEARGREEKAHQAVTASKRTEPMVSDLIEQVGRVEIRCAQF